MKYWKGLPSTPKVGQCGTMDDGGFVPDSTPITKIEYDIWVASQPTPTPPKRYIELKDNMGKILRYEVMKEELV